MKNKAQFIFLLFIFLMNVGFSLEAFAGTGPCRKIERRSVCMPDGGPTEGPPGGCVCSYCISTGQEGEYTYGGKGCTEYATPPICPPEGCTQGPCVHWSCKDQKGKCWSEDNGTM